MEKLEKILLAAIAKGPELVKEIFVGLSLLITTFEENQFGTIVFIMLTAFCFVTYFGLQVIK